MTRSPVLTDPISGAIWLRMYGRLTTHGRLASSHMLLDWTGRELRQDKRGAIPDHLAPILDRLGLDGSNWVQTARDFGRMFKQAAGRWSSLARAAPRCSRRWFHGRAAAQLAFL